MTLPTSAWYAIGAAIFATVLWTGIGILTYGPPLWRRFVYWLVRDQIIQAHERGYLEAGHVDTAARRAAFAAGQIAGRQEMLEQMAAQVNARTHGLGDIVSLEDIEQARKGMLH